jgi:hypothetical protein
MNSCSEWNNIQRGVDRETSAADRVRAARHVRACDPCRSSLRALVRVRRTIQAIPLIPLDAALSARIQASLMLERNLALQAWLRRSTAIAATILVACTLAIAFGGSAANGGDTLDPMIVTSDVDQSDGTPQAVAQWIVQDLSP